MDQGSFFKNKHVLITGGLGFIGSHVASQLVTLGSHVTVVDSLIPEFGGNLFNVRDIQDKIKINISDVRDPHSFKYLVQGMDVLFNLAGQTSHMDSMQDPFTDLEINCKAQLSILETCRKYNPKIKIVFASTRQIYGKPDYLPVDEAHPLRPVDANGVNKMAGEWYHILYNNVYNIGGTVLRLTNTYGPCMRVKDARQTFLGIWIKHLLQGQPIEVWGGEQLRDFNYVEDVVSALLIAASSSKANGKIYNLGSKEVISLKDLADLMIRIYGSGKCVIKTFPEDRKKIDIGNYYSDSRLIQSELHWQPQVALQEGLTKTFDFYKKHLAAYL